MNSLNRDGEKMSKDDIAFWESVKDLPLLKRATRCSLRWGTGACQTNTPKDQWKEVDERFDELQVSYMSPEVDGLVIREQLGLDDDTEKVIKDFLHSELEKVRQEAKASERKKIIGLLRENLLMAKQDGKFYEKEYGGSKTDPRIRVNYLLHRLDDLDQAISAITNKK